MLNCIFSHAVSNSNSQPAQIQTDIETPHPNQETTSNDTKRKIPSLQAIAEVKRPKLGTSVVGTTTKKGSTSYFGTELGSALASTEDAITEDIELVPKVITPYPPAQVPVRFRYLALLQHLYESLGDRLPNKLAVEKEFEIASSTTGRTYEVVIKREIYQMANPEHFPKKLQEQSKKFDKWEKLQNLVHDKKTLANSGYVTDIPQLSPDFELPVSTKCERCGQEFEIGKITVPVICKYHPERVTLSRKTQGSYASNDINSRFYPCCNQPVGETEGCQKCESHVYKFAPPECLQKVSPFISTDNFPVLDSQYKAVALDCEMGYTTLGFEMIRVTVLDFETETALYDKTVKTKGDIIDLNTYWSGVLEIDDMSPDLEQFQDELSQLVGKDTIIIGHGLENDLNVMRLVHLNVIDTSIMFPRGMRKKSLKEITFQYLSQKIQTGEHDSEEDARSCIGLVKWFLNR